MKNYNIAIVGATGAVGIELLKILEERNFGVNSLRLYASPRSIGRSLEFRGEIIPVFGLDDASFKGLDFVFFSAGKSVSKEYVPKAAAVDAIVIDNSAAFRLKEDVPLVVPEINPEALSSHKRIIANPNCSTIQLVVAIKPLYDISKIKRLVISTYQSVSGTGWKAVLELQEQIEAYIKKRNITAKIYPHQIAFNVFPHIGEFDARGYCEEELKLINETKKILNDYFINITATTVRVPVFRGHALSVNIEFEDKVTAEEARETLKKAKGVEVLDECDRCIYPHPLEVAGKDKVYVGRIREDTSCSTGLNLWIVADNLRKGAALNAVQIAETIIRNEA